MAEFKLGRIRFVWKGEWAPGTTYFRDDIVRLNGRTYTCIIGHTASALFSTDESDVEPKWELVADGQQWKSDWTINTRYEKNDIVKYGGYLYIANTAHTSAADTLLGLEDDQASWDLFAEGFDWKGDWGTGVRYKINDVVKYNAYLYLCTQEHNSAASEADGLELDQAKWDVFSKGFEWRLQWATSTRYRKGDVVRYGGQIYVCNTGHTSAVTEDLGLEDDQAYWDEYHKGIEYRDEWASGTRYRVNDLVKYGGSIWICKTYHTATVSLAADEINWEIFVPGLEFEDSWQAGITYQPGDFVTYGGYSYIAKTNNKAVKPNSSEADWQLFVTGFNFRGDWGADSSTEEYTVGDVVRLNGFTYLCILEHSGQVPPNTTYWEKLNSGILHRAAWADLTFYDQGDVVTYGVNSYICILEHTANNATNRPDLDVTGTYWNILSGGPESGNLTTTGDIVYYSGSGPTRLPVGQPGQVLVVNNDSTAPQWTYLGKVNNAYYVSLLGTDEPAPNYGVSLDRPWRTVRYAADQVLKGAEYFNARNLLERNRSFIQAEIVEWVDFQINNVIAPFTGAFTYDKEQSRRDMGVLIDAIIHDMSHGGNVKSRAAALAYYATGGLDFIGGQDTETVAAITYGIEVIDAVLTNLAPAANYQSLNGVGSPITQQIDATFTEEPAAQTLAESLISIVTNAIVAGDTNGVPAERRANNTIFVKTGRQEEILPIRVPADTAIVGDELRSTQIAPAASSLGAGDATYSLAALTRLSAVISDVVTNVSITKSTSNAETQVTTRPAGTVGSSANKAAVEANVDEMLDILTNGPANADALVFTDTGVTAKTTARTELQTNRAAIISDLIAWIGTNYPGLTYDQTKCERDTGYIIDGLSYDIQYGGNWATTIMARAYYEGAVAVLPAGQQAETAAAFTQLKTIVTNYMSGATEEAEAATLLDEIINVINNGIGALATITYPVVTWTAADKQTSHADLLAAKTEIQNQTVAHVKINNPGFSFNENTCFRDSGYIVDALAYDMAFGSNVQSVFSGISYHRATASAQIVINSQLSATQEALNFIKIKAGFIAYGGPGLKAVDILDSAIAHIDFEVNANGALPQLFGSNSRMTNTKHTYAVEVLEANRTFLVEEAVAFINDTYPAYVYDAARFRREINGYIDSLKYDLIYTGNYETLFHARTYVNAINGSITEDMFYMRNGTGLRNCTTIGLTGSLGSPNSYGTQRPTAGAYVSLDPGFGPYDTEAWIATKSPYVQNVSTFGTGCVGMKVDGDLHSGGNDSIVANDFTQILSDGIGAWVTNLGRAELVSVFCYYNHIGYLAENGGKIRATNGNNSYGAYGSVAEGIDNTETPITGTVNNRGLEARVGYVFTDGAEEILQIEYLNAGRDYTASTTAIQTINNISPADNTRVVGTYQGITGTTSGTGTGQEFKVIVTEGGLANITIVKGGTGHVQGDTITISDADLGGGGAADLTFDVNLVGDATVWSITGEGFGAQVATTTVYNGGVSNVRLLETQTSPSNYGGADYVTASSNAQIGNATSIRLALTDTAGTGVYDGMAIWIVSGKGAGQYGVIDSYNGGTKEATIVKVSDGTPGWDVIVPGTPVETTLDITSAYVIEPRVIFSAPVGGGTTARGRARVSNGQVVEIRIIEPGSGYNASTDIPTMTLVDPNNTVDAPHEVFVGDGVLGQPTWTSRGTGFVTAQAEITGDGYAEIYQPGTYVRVEGLTAEPVPGANVEFDSISGKVYKLVNVTGLLGSGPYTALLQVSPEISVSEAPDHGDPITMRSRYSQVRLTGHDFLDIGTGNFSDTNYPGIPVNPPNPEVETNEFGGGRVFYTSTDQDGNFRVGGLFNVEQATGVATLNVDAFNISGLQELQLGEIGLGEAGAVIREFSTDGTFAADSDNIVPTQKAIKTYISSQIGGGASTLNVNSVTAGLVEISGQQITTTTGDQLNILAKVNFTGGISGAPVAFNYFLLS